MFDFLKSSAGDGKVSERVKSLMLAALPVILFAAPLFGFQITNPEEGISTIVAVIAAVELAISAVWHLKGWADRNFRKQNSLGAFSHER